MRWTSLKKIMAILHQMGQSLMAMENKMGKMDKIKKKRREASRVEEGDIKRHQKANKGKS